MPTIRKDMFPNSVDGSYWSASTYTPRTDWAWVVDFRLGNDGVGDKTLFSRRVRCVSKP